MAIMKLLRLYFGHTVGAKGHKSGIDLVKYLRQIMFIGGEEYGVLFLSIIVLDGEGVVFVDHI
jgi:hypothetical protein